MFLFDFNSYVLVNIFSVISVQVFLDWTSTKQELTYFAQGHIAVTPVRLEPAALRSRVKHTTTEPLHSPWAMFIKTRDWRAIVHSPERISHSICLLEKDIMFFRRIYCKFGNFCKNFISLYAWYFCVLLYPLQVFFVKSTISKKSFRNTISMSNSLDTDQVLGLNRWQKSP